MKILERYIFKESLSYFFITLVIFLSLALISRIVNFANLIVNKGVGFLQIVQIFLAIIPTFLQIALPLSLLLGVMLAFARLSGDSEIIIIRASGISIGSLLKPVIILGILVVCWGYYNSFELEPAGNRLLNHTLYEIARTKSTSGISAGMFNKVGELVIYADEISYSDGKLHNAMIDDRRGGSADGRQIIFAREGVISSDDHARKIIFDLTNGIVHQRVKSGEYQITKFAQNRLVLSSDDIYGDASLKVDKRGKELTLAELSNEIQLLTDQDYARSRTPEGQRRLRRLLVEQASRFAEPWSNLLLGLLAVALGIVPPRTQKTWGASFSLALGVGVFLIYYSFLTIGISLGEDGVINRHLAVWIPNILIGSFVWYALRKTISERWQSVADGLSIMLAAIIRKRGKDAI